MQRFAQKGQRGLAECLSAGPSVCKKADRQLDVPLRGLNKAVVSVSATLKEVISDTDTHTHTADERP